MKKIIFFLNLRHNFINTVSIFGFDIKILLLEIHRISWKKSSLQLVSQVLYVWCELKN